MRVRREGKALLGEERKLSRVVAFRVTLTRFHLIKAAAAEEGSTVSGFVGRVVMSSLEQTLPNSIHGEEE